MKNKKFASFLAAAAALVLLAMPAFAADEQTELPAAEAAEVQQEQTAAPAEQETIRQLLTDERIAFRRLYRRGADGAWQEAEP